MIQAELKEILHYDPDAGIFTRLKSGHGTRAGDVAGYTHKTGYVYIWAHGKKRLAHRLVWLYMTGRWPDYEIDHINHIKDDNRLVNLREASKTDNQRNMKLHKHNKSGTSGVTWNKEASKWQARIGDGKESRHLGTFECIDDAIAVRKDAEKAYGYHENHGK
jgi:hypothetical protein